MRKLFIKKLIELSIKKKNIYLVINDLGFNVVEPFKNKFPKKFFNVGVAEQNLMGISAGIASEKAHVFSYSIANFNTFRCAEQIRNDIDYHLLPVTIVSVGSGVGYGNLGYSHHAVQDYTLMRSFPNMLILSPGNENELINIMDFIVQNPQPSYLRLDKDENLKNEKIKKNTLKPGKIYRVVDGSKQIVIITTGKTQEIAIKLTQKKYRGYSVFSAPIWGMNSRKIFYSSIKKFKKIVTIEDHFYSGGFGSWVNEILNLKNSKIHLNSEFISNKSMYDVGSKKYLMEKYGPK